MSDFAPAAKIVADSVSAITGDRLTTVELTIPRVLLPNLLADINIARSFTDVLDAPVADNMRVLADTPVVPLYWPSATIQNHPAPPMRREKAAAARETWLRARDEAVACAETLTTIGAHHSIANRLLEPYLPQRVLLTSTEWRDFFDQRLQRISTDPLVSADLTEVTDQVRRLLEKSQPEKLSLGEWHLPYIRSFELNFLPVTQAIQVSIARCNSGIDPEEEIFNIEQDLEHYAAIMRTAKPALSPLEHVATPASRREPVHGVTRGWHQYRYHRGDR